MESITVRHKRGKATLNGDTITVQHVSFSRTTPQQIPLLQIVAIHHSVTIPSAFGKGGAMSITLRLASAPSVDLELVSPLPAAQRLVATIEQTISERPGAIVQTVPPGDVSPVVVIPVAMTPPLQEQLVKVYRGANCTKQFQKDVKKLAAHGWRVQSHSYGGQTGKAGAVVMFGVLGLAAGTKPREITVIYVRS